MLKLIKVTQVDGMSLFFKMATNMAAVSKMATGKMWFSVFQQDFCIRHLLDTLAPTSCNFSYKMATNMATKLKMTVDKNMAFCISTRFWRNEGPAA